MVNGLLHLRRALDIFGEGHSITSKGSGVGHGGHQQLVQGQACDAAALADTQIFIMRAFLA